MAKKIEVEIGEAMYWRISRLADTGKVSRSAVVRALMTQELYRNFGNLKSEEAEFLDWAQHGQP